MKNESVDRGLRNILAQRSSLPGEEMTCPGGNGLFEESSPF
jgi:hypothetical protein